MRRDERGECEIDPGAPTANAERYVTSVAGSASSAALCLDAHQELAALGEDILGDQGGRGARVIGEDAHVDVVAPGAANADLARVLRGAIDEDAEEIGVVVRGHALERGGNALEAHAGVDARRGERRSRRVVRGVVVLREDQVPDLGPAEPSMRGSSPKRNTSGSLPWK